MNANIHSDPIADSANPIAPEGIRSLIRGAEADLFSQLMPIVRIQSVSLDLSQVERIDAAGIAALIALYRAAREAGRSFGVTSPTPHVKEILGLVGLDKFLMNENSDEASEDVCPEPELSQSAA